MLPRQKSHLSGRLGSLSARRKASSTSGVSDASEKGSKRATGEKLKFRSPTPKFFKRVKSRSPCDLVAFRFIKSSLLPLILLRPIGIYSSRDEMRRFCAAQQTMRRRRRRRMRNKRNGARVPAPLCVACFVLTCFSFGVECTEDVSISDPAEIVHSPEFNFGISVNVMGRGRTKAYVGDSSCTYENAGDALPCMKWDNFEGEDSEKMLKLVDNSDEMLTGEFEIKYKIESTEVFMDKDEWVLLLSYDHKEGEILPLTSGVAPETLTDANSHVWLDDLDMTSDDVESVKFFCTSG